MYYIYYVRCPQIFSKEFFYILIENEKIDSKKSWNSILFLQGLRTYWIQKSTIK